MSRRPNILGITTDHLRCDSLGCYDSQWAHSPSLDELARLGVRSVTTDFEWADYNSDCEVNSRSMDGIQQPKKERFRCRQQAYMPQFAR